MKQHPNNCPICEKGQIMHKKQTNHTEYKGFRGVLALYYSICDTCGSEQADAEQALHNKQQMVVFKRSVEETIKASL